MGGAAPEERGGQRSGIQLEDERRLALQRPEDQRAIVRLAGSPSAQQDGPALAPVAGGGLGPGDGAAGRPAAGEGAAFLRAILAASQQQEAGALGARVARAFEPEGGLVRRPPAGREAGAGGGEPGEQRPGRRGQRQVYRGTRREIGGPQTRGDGRDRRRRLRP